MLNYFQAVVVTNSISQTKNVESGKLKNKFHVLDVSGKLEHCLMSSKCSLVFTRRSASSKQITNFGYFLKQIELYFLNFQIKF